MRFVSKGLVLVFLMVFVFAAGYALDHLETSQVDSSDWNEIKKFHHQNQKNQAESVENKISDAILNEYITNDENVKAGEGQASKLNAPELTNNEEKMNEQTLRNSKGLEKLNQNSIRPTILNFLGSGIKVNQNSLTNNVEDDHWKALAMSVYCSTGGTYSSKAEGVVKALDDAYPDNDWIVYVGADWAGWAYAYNGWDVLDKRRFCGSNDLLVFGRVKKGCRKSVQAAAKLLQSGALADAKTAIQARDLMKAREGVYDLDYDLIFVYSNSGGSSWRYVHSLGCYSPVYRNGFWSLWDGRATD